MVGEEWDVKVGYVLNRLRPNVLSYAYQLGHNLVAWTMPAFLHYPMNVSIHFSLSILSFQVKLVLH